MPFDKDPKMVHKPITTRTPAPAADPVRHKFSRETVAAECECRRYTTAEERFERWWRERWATGVGGDRTVNIKEEARRAYLAAVEEGEREMEELRSKVRSLEAFKRSVDESLNEGDGSYRP